MSGHVDDYLVQIRSQVNGLPTPTAALGVLGLDRMMPPPSGGSQHQHMLPPQHVHQSPPPTDNDPWWQPAIDFLNDTKQEVEENPWEIPILIAGLPDGVTEALVIIVVIIAIIIVLAVIISALIQKLQDHQKQQKNTQFKPPPNLKPVPAPTPGPAPGQLTQKQQRLVQSISQQLTANGVHGIEQSDIENLVRLGYDRDTIIQILLAGIPTSLPPAEINAQLATLNSRIHREPGSDPDMSEMRLAYYLANQGKNITFRAANSPGRNPDAVVNGAVTEFKSLDPGATSNTVRRRVQESISRGGQARNIIFDARGSGLTEAEAERSFRRIAGIANGKIDSVRIIGDGYDITSTDFH